MNFFYRSLESAQEQARQAAAQASALAQQVGQQTAQLASSASDQAQQSLKGLSVPTSLQQRLESLRLPGAQQQAQAAPSDEQLRAYGITPECQGFVRGLNYASFRDSQGSEQASPSASSSSQPEGRYLTRWQEQHALLICRQVKEVDELRFVLSPKRMTDQQFWAIYFQLVRQHLPEAAYDPAAPLPELSSQPAGSQPAATMRQQLQQLSTSAQQWMAGSSSAAAESPAKEASSSAPSARPDADAASASQPAQTRSAAGQQQSAVEPSSRDQPAVSVLAGWLGYPQWLLCIL